MGEDRCQKIRLVSADAAEWIADVVASRCENATVCIDSFHVVQWTTDALDEVRREVWNEARRLGMREHGKELKGCRPALWRNREDLTARQEARLSAIARVNSRLYRACLLKEQLRIAIRTTGVLAPVMLEYWLLGGSLAIPTFVELGRKIRRNLPSIEAAMLNRLSNALVESTNRAAPDGFRLQRSRAPDRARALGSWRILPTTTRARSLTQRLRQHSLAVKSAPRPWDSLAWLGRS